MTVSADSVRPPRNGVDRGPMPPPRRTRGCYRYVRLRWRLLVAVIDGLGNTVAAIVRRLPARAKQHSVAGNASPAPKRILLIQLDHLGDAVISTVMLPALRQRFPQAAIEVLAAPWNREVFECSPEVDQVHVCGVNRFSRKHRLLWAPATVLWGLRLRRRRIDLGIDVRGEFPHAVILWLSGARRRVGWPCGGGEFLLTHGAAYVLDRPETQSRLALLEAAGVPSSPTATPRPVLRPTQEARREIQTALVDLDRGIPNRGPRIVLHVGAGTPAKRWPVPSWQRLIDHLLARTDARLILVGTDDDRATAQYLRGKAHRHTPADWTGRLNLVQLAALLERSDLLIGADSGPAHLAAAVGTPVVTLFSGTNNPVQWQPVGEPVAVVRNPVPCSPCHRRRCPLRDHPCMTGIAPSEVADAAEAMVAASRNRLRQTA